MYDVVYLVPEQQVEGLEGLIIPYRVPVPVDVFFREAAQAKKPSRASLPHFSAPASTLVPSCKFSKSQSFLDCAKDMQ